jgi:hypothetical protein
LKGVAPFRPRARADARLALVRSEIKVMPEAVVKGELRPLRNPADDPD